MTGVLNSHIHRRALRSGFGRFRGYHRGLNLYWGNVTQEDNDNVPQSDPRVHGARYWAGLVNDIAQSRDEAAFHTLYNYFAPRVKSFLLRSGISESVAEDVAQETLMTLWRRAEIFNPDRASVSTWIFTIARNKKIDQFRKDAKPLPDVNDPSYAWRGDDSPETQTSQNQFDADIHAALSTLPEEQKQVLTLSFLEEQPHHEIAKVLGIPLGTVKSRIRLGLKRLRGRVGNHYGDEQ